MSETPRPTAWEQLKQSRKFLVFLIVTTPLIFVVTLAGVAIVYAMVRGKISFDIGLGLIGGALTVGYAGAVALGMRVVDGIIKEDVARIEAQSPKAPLVGAIATGEHGSAAQNQVQAANAEVVAPPASARELEPALAVTPVDNPARATVKK